MIMLGFFWWQRLAPKPSPALPKLPEVFVTSPVPGPLLPTPQFTASMPEITTLPAYRYNPLAGEPQERVARFAEVLGFSGVPTELKDALRGAIFVWSKPNETLTVDGSAQSLSYSHNLISDPEALLGIALPAPDEAARIVERALNELYPPSNLLRYDPKETRYLRAGVARAEPAPSSEADIVEIHFTAAVDDYPLHLNESPVLDPVLAWVGKDGKILSLEYHLLGTVGEKIGDYPVKSQEDIVQTILNGQATMVNSTFEGNPSLRSVSIIGVEPIFLAPAPGQTVLQPVLSLTARALAETGEQGVLTVYVPAVK